MCHQLEQIRTISHNRDSLNHRQALNPMEMHHYRNFTRTAPTDRAPRFSWRRPWSRRLTTAQ